MCIRRVAAALMQVYIHELHCNFHIHIRRLISADVFYTGTQSGFIYHV